MVACLELRASAVVNGVKWEKGQAWYPLDKTAITPRGESYLQKSHVVLGLRSSEACLLKTDKQTKNELLQSRETIFPKQF